MCSAARRASAAGRPGEIDVRRDSYRVRLLGLRRRHMLCPGPFEVTQPNQESMKSIRVLLALSVFALCAGLASANCGTCEKKDQCTDADKAACAEKCDKAKADCPKDCDKPCCKKDGAAADQAKCEKKMKCCEEAAKAGKTCEKCNPPAAEKK